MILNELFDRPYPIKIFPDQAVAKDPKGRPLYVVFDRYPAWETVKVTFDRGGDFSLTDWRDEFSVFATVIKAIQQWADKYQPGSMYFSVPQDEPTNRMRLYQKMVAALASGSGYTEISDPDRVDDDAISYYMARIGKRFGDDRFWWLVRDDLIKSQQTVTEDLSPESAQELWIKNYGEEMAERVFYNIKQELLFAVNDLCSIRTSACDTKDRLEAMSRTEFVRWVLTYFTGALEQNGWPEAHSEGIAQVIRDRVRQPLLNKQCLLENFTEGKLIKYGGILMSITEGEDGFLLKAYSLDRKPLGFVEMWYDTDGTIRSEDLEVYEPYRGQGIAKTMYDFIKSQGFTIARSSEQTPAGAGFWDKHRGSGQRIWEQDVDENFADGKVKGKSRPGRVKRAGASCAGSVTNLRQKAKKYGGERGKMYHWCANMKSGRKNK